MTGDRYRFAADFTVIDGRTDQPRSPRTLSGRAGTGQTIMVIRHVATVAQRIERVLRVTPSPSGSSAEWIDDADRDALFSLAAHP
jgi:hypothetical protein